MYIEKIDSPRDLKKLTEAQLNELCSEMRKLLIKKTSICGGHLASNLGVVELTVALHYVFDAPEDKIIFDVSHQTYCHKMLTGRKDAFLYPECYGNVSGFTCSQESEYDLFTIGHTSTSISLALGMAKARDLKGTNENIVAVIGDSSLDGGEAYEAMNYAGEMNTGLIVVVNDNDMSIPENHGFLNKRLNELRDNNGESSDNLFKALGFQYVFVRDGNSIEKLVAAFNSIKDTNHPVIVHVCTQKGKGYAPAENNREKFHWAHPFDIRTGEFISNVPKENYGAIAREFLLDKMQKDSDVVVVTASTPLCIGFNAESREKAGKQFVDVGIAEQNAVSMAAGIAKNGGKPIFATNSTFYQRAYDQIEQEICINNLPVTMIVTHGSVYGHTNETHAGLFDIAMLGNVPHLIYLAPANKEEYLAMLEWSIEQNERAVAIRVPWTGVRNCCDDEVDKQYDEVSYQINQKGSKVAVLALGGFYSLGQDVAKLYEDRTGIKVTLINPKFITGIDVNTLDGLKKDHDIIITLEDGILSGGFGAKISQYYSTCDMKVMNYGFSMEIPNVFDSKELMKKNRLVPEQIVEDIIKIN